METGAITAIIGLLSLIVGGIFAFCREVVKAAHADRDWWRDKGFVILETQQKTIEAQVKADEQRDAKLGEALDILREAKPDTKSEGESDGN